MSSPAFSPIDLVRPNVRRLSPYRCARESVLEGILLDANENPFPCRKEGLLLNRYPDPLQRRLRQALAGHLGVGFDSVLASNGSDEAIDWVFKTFLEPGRDEVAIPEPTYGMYRVTADIYGIPVREYRLNADFGFDFPSFLEEAPRSVKALFLCSPNNPTGNLLDGDRILELAAAWPGLVVVDEAYIEFSGAESLAAKVAGHPNLVVLRTLSKAHGRAGLRLGYVVADPSLIDCFLKVKSPYNLSAPVQAEGLRALENQTEARAQVAVLLASRAKVAEELRSIPGVERVHPSDANFLLFRCRQSSTVCRRLAAEGIVVRDRGDLPGLQGCIRVTIGTEEENRLFLSRLRALLEGI